MNNELERKRLLFAIARGERSLQFKPENLVAKARRVSGHKCQDARQEFSYLRNQAIVSVDNEMLNANTKITPALLKRSTQRVIAESAKVAETNLSA